MLLACLKIFFFCNFSLLFNPACSSFPGAFPWEASSHHCCSDVDRNTTLKFQHPSWVETHSSNADVSAVSKLYFAKTKTQHREVTGRAHACEVGSLFHQDRPGGAEQHQHSGSPHTGGAGYPTPSHYTPPLTFVVEGPIKVVAASVEASGKLNQVSCPSVPSPRKAGQGNKLLGAGGQEPAVHAAVVCEGRMGSACSISLHSDQYCTFISIPSFCMG